MKKLYFFYSTMNAGKTALLLQFNHNCIKRNINTIILTTNTTTKNIYIESRIGLKKIALPITYKTKIFDYIKKYKYMIKNILIDEAQFLTNKQVYELSKIVDHLNINVYTYGLKTNFKMNLFEGSKYLLIFADKIIEIKTLCKCGKKAIANAKINQFGQKIIHGNIINLNKKIYIPVCRYHYINFNKLK